MKKLNDYVTAYKEELEKGDINPKMQFEVWLLGQTIPIQEKYWQFFKTAKWNNDRATKPKYSILEAILIENPDFNDLDLLSQQVESKLVTVSSNIIDDIKKSKLS